MTDLWHVAVIVPACNEEALLPRCLRSLEAARRALPREATCDIVLAADACTDTTWAVASAMLHGRGAVVETKVGNVGLARALATQAALQRSPVRLTRCWLANTDADCEVPEDWLTKQLHLARSGVCAVAGVVDVDSFAEHRPHVAERFRFTYSIAPDGSHPHVHGANIGFRADCYLMAGGWAPLKTAEDHDLWRRLGELPVDRRQTAALRVITSGRRVGRAPAGFAGALAAHNLYEPGQTA